MSNDATARAVSDLRLPMISVLVMSGVINVVALAGALYMLQVYDRVLTSQSVPTLVVLTILVACVYVAHGILEALRGQLLLRVGMRLDEIVMPAAYAQLVKRPLAGHAHNEAFEPVRDVDTVRSFLAGPGPVAVADLPWTPVFLGFVTVISPTLGLMTAGGLALIVALAVVTDRATGDSEQQTRSAASLRGREIEATLRNHESIHAMGMLTAASDRFHDRHHDVVASQRKAGDRVIVLAAISRVTRMMLQSAILGMGAYLSLSGELTLGAIVAASIAATRALVPIEQAISSWHALSVARGSMSRLMGLDRERSGSARHVTLPVPRGTLSLEQVSLRAPGSGKPLLFSLSMRLSAGQGVAIVGASGAGKSSLARVIAGVWPASIGTVRLDGTPIERWDSEDRGRFIGYLPQSVELFPGTIAENIARLDDRPDADAVIQAAREAGLHDLILDLPSGYDTRLEPGGTQLSAGQRQLLGIARALYGRPFLVVLDEPNANLDEAGERALLAALHGVRARGGIAIVVAHRRSILSALDMIAILDGGRLKAFGPKVEVMRNLPERIDDAPLETRITALRTGSTGGVTSL